MAKVLLVEDEAAILILAESILQDAGHRTSTASNVEQAIALISGDRFTIDLLFTDIGLGKAFQGGIEVAQQAVKLHPKVRVLYTTGQVATDGLLELFVRGSALLPKPYTASQLVETVELLLNERQTFAERDLGAA